MLTNCGAAHRQSDDVRLSFPHKLAISRIQQYPTGTACRDLFAARQGTNAAAHLQHLASALGPLRRSVSVTAERFP